MIFPTVGPNIQLRTPSAMENMIPAITLSIVLSTMKKPSSITPPITTLFAKLSISIDEIKVRNLFRLITTHSVLMNSLLPPPEDVRRQNPIPEYAHESRHRVCISRVEPSLETIFCTTGPRGPVVVGLKRGRSVSRKHADFGGRVYESVNPTNSDGNAGRTGSRFVRKALVGSLRGRQCRKITGPDLRPLCPRCAG